MKAIKLILVVSTLILSQSYLSMGQGYVEDALRFSQHQNTGSARITAIGGTQNSIGGDISNVHGNPAGLGFFQRSEFSLSAAYSDWNADTRVGNQGSSYNTTNFSLPNLGAVISRAKAPLEIGDWRGGSFGISLNRQASYNNNEGYYFDQPGQPSQESILNYYRDLYINEGLFFGGTDGLFYEAFLINPENGGYSLSPNATVATGLGKSEIIENEGNMTQVSFSYGGNYKDKLFLGASLGINTVSFRSTKTYNEDFYDGNRNTTLFHSLQENLFVDGSGINLGLGLIYKPVDRLNFGINFKSPTWNRFNEEYDADIFADFFPPYQDPEAGSIAESDEQTDVFISSYNLRTPMKIGTGLTYFFGKNGFITADVNYLNFSTNHLRSNVFNSDEYNLEIGRMYGQTINYSVGGEYRLDIFRVRAGYAFYGDPFRDPQGFNRSTTQFSGGIGVKMTNFYIDLGIVNSLFNSYFYSYPESELATTENNRITGMLTLGFNF